MRRHEARVGRQHRLEGGDDRAFDRPDIGDDRPRPQRRSDGARDRFIRPDRHGEDDAIGAAGRPSRIIGDDVAKAERLRPLEDPDRMIGEDDASRSVPAAGGAGDRRADQSDPDNRKLIEDRLGERRSQPLNHLRPA